jgi:adenosyl cobinamide kinase/adenosyl cobinamide phosphate guanylyltransferase
MQINLITGEIKSGKSEFAENLIVSQFDPNSVLYVGTLPYWQNSFLERINKHRERRHSLWRTIEINNYYKTTVFDKLIISQHEEVVLIDGVHMLYLFQLIKQKDDPIRTHIQKLLTISDKKKLYLVVPIPKEPSHKYEVNLFNYYLSLTEISNSIYKI